MKEVTKQEYYDSFMNLDAIHHVDDSKGYPYASNWTLRNNSRVIIARSEPTNKQGTENKYFIKE